MMSAALVSFLRTLCTLRWFTVVGQMLTLLVVTSPMQIVLDEVPLWSGIAVLAGFNLLAIWRLRRQSASTIECFLHLLVDVMALAWMISHSGGITNPFGSLFLLPIALAALALPRRWVIGVAVCSVSGYAIAAACAAPLPHIHGSSDRMFDLHLIGMSVNFAVSVATVLFFFTRLVAQREVRERELAELRERFVRNEGIVALATHAAAVAHELNTPLATMTLVLDDLIEQPTNALRDDHLLLRNMLGVCRDRVRELAAPAAAFDGLGVDLDALVAQWLLSRPGIELKRSGKLDRTLRFEPAIGHLLQTLLHNSADASTLRNNAGVEIDLVDDGSYLHVRVRDHGPGFADVRAFVPGMLSGSAKPDGLGVGLVLARATVERLGGTLTLEPVHGSGACVRLSVPLSNALRSNELRDE